MQVKYAYLVFNLPFPFPRSFGTFNFDSSTQIQEGTVRDQKKGPDAKHWAERLGSITWDALDGNRFILSTWGETNNPEVSEGEYEKLRKKIATIFRVLPLVAPLCPPFEEAFIFSGKGSYSEKGLFAEDIRTFSRIDCWTRSYYNEHHWDEFHNWAKDEIMKPSLLNAWKSCHSQYDKLFIQGKTNRQLFESYRSFEEAMKGTQLEFKMPNLVRAMECVIDCWTFKEFASRVLLLTGAPADTLPYSISVKTEELLQDLYQLRNDCSHGKPFAYSLGKKLGKPPDGAIVAKYEFLAEWAARKILNDSFANSSILQHSNERDSLVDAWNKGLIKV